ncbi:outer membrane efflux protein [Caballeronia cordobensis]|nr:outer membrane efflux protein [Burkholderia sp. RPE67]
MSTNKTPDVDVRAGVDWGSDRFAQDRMRSDGGKINATLSYDLDVGGKLAAQRDAAEWNVSAVESDGDSTRLQMIKESLEMYWKLGFLSEKLKFAREGLARAKKALVIVQARYDAGDVSKTDVVQAQQNVIANALAIERLNEQVIQDRNALAILMGQPPETTVNLPEALPFRPLRPIAAGLPADVIRRRSDVLAAEWRLRQAFANIDVTRSDLYPSLTLTSSVGTSSVSLERFLSSPITNLGLAVALPFIQWNRTKLRIKISEVDFDVAAHQFRATVFSALREVEDELTTGAKLERQEAQLSEQLENARRAAHLAEMRFIAGETAVQPLLQEQQSLMEAQKAVAQNHLDRLTNRAALSVALGGGTQDTKEADF